MKRSEMIKHIQYSFVSKEIQDSAGAILKILEDAGMLPPKQNLYDPESSYWEPEDEN